jgi:acetyl-CoA carboxylase biotin carboxylase subunit
MDLWPKLHVRGCSSVFRKLLIANRGEIAVRVIRACRELGIATVAVYSEADRAALHVRMADEAYPIGPPPARESYLVIEKLIDVARRSGAEAVHPGYGFLAENAEFARACREAGLIFVGPSPEAIELMGDKVAARNTVMQVGVPTVPGTAEEVTTVEAAFDTALRIGYPILIKAAAGGGGKGMRIVRTAEELPDAFRAASSEATSAFGYGGVYMERLLEKVRHVEVQVLADNYGNVIHLGERECSIQRRHQKLLEESPSPAVSEDLRSRLGDAAVRAARAAGYCNAGTVEFLLDGEGNFYFLEMNTRIQVEHPVTEMVTGVDLVAEQIRIAAGERLRYRQEDIRLRGAAMECRIASEDPYNNFLPSTGCVTFLQEPAGPGIRVDSALYEGFEVTLYYDPMIAKVIAWAEDRAAVIKRMQRALREFRILGVSTNIPFHLWLLDHPAFLRGDVDTAFLEREYRQLSTEDGLEEAVALVATAIAHVTARKKRARIGDGAAAAVNPWRMAARRDALR